MSKAQGCAVLSAQLHPVRFSFPLSLAEADAARAAVVPAPAALARPEYHPRNCQLVLADHNRARVPHRPRKRPHVGKCQPRVPRWALGALTRRGRLQWQDPRQPDLLLLPDVWPLWLPTTVAEMLPLGADPQASRVAEAALRAVVDVLLDPAATVHLEHAIRRLIPLKPQRRTVGKASTVALLASHPC